MGRAFWVALRIDAGRRALAVGMRRGIGGKKGRRSAVTSFPMPLHSAASFNRTLFTALAAAIRDELRQLARRGRGGLAVWSPNINRAPFFLSLDISEHADGERRRPVSI